MSIVCSASTTRPATMRSNSTSPVCAGSWPPDGSRSRRSEVSDTRWLPGSGSMMPPGGSLYARVVTRLVLVLLVTGTTLVLAAWFYAKLAADEAFDQVLVAGALQIAENTWLRNDVLNVDVPVSAFYVMSRRDRVFYKVIDPSGKVIAGDPELPLSLQMDSLQ